MINNKLTAEIIKKVRSLRLKKGTINISISKDPVEQEYNGEVYDVRWICWSIDDSNGAEVAEPEFGIVHPSLTIDTLIEDIGNRYMGFDITFDHNVEAPPP